MINKDELLYKLNAIKLYLEEHNGKQYKVYNRLCPGMGEPDSNIIEYLEDIEVIVEELFKKLES